MWMKPLKNFGAREQVGVGKYDGRFYVCVEKWDRDSQKLRYEKYGGPCWTMEEAEEEALETLARFENQRDDKRWEDMT